METVKLSRRQSAHMAELSEDYRGGMRMICPPGLRTSGALRSTPPPPRPLARRPGDHRFARERRTDLGGNASWHESL